MTRCKSLRFAFRMNFVLVLTVLCALGATPLLAQAPPAPALLAEHYDVSATLDPLTQSISAVAKIDFKARDVSSTARVELHPNLDIKEIKTSDGKSLKHCFKAKEKNNT